MHGVDTKTAPVDLNVKRVEDDTFCYSAVSTRCEEQTRTVEKEVCTYTYSSKKETRPATVTQVKYHVMLLRDKCLYRLYNQKGS